MKLEFFKQSFEKLKNESRWYRTIGLALVVSNILLVYGLMTQRPVVVMQPFTLNEPAKVMAEDATRSYTEAWALAISELVGNIQPSTVDFVVERLKPVLDSSIYHEVLDALEKNAEDIKNDRASYRFEPNEVIYEKSSKKIFVQGHEYTRVGTSLAKEKKSLRTFEMKFVIRNYMPKLTHITTYDGRARTSDVLERMEKEAEHKKAKARKNALENRGYSTQTKESEE